MVENFDATRAQAINMSTFAGIELRPKQIKLYSLLRDCQEPDCNTKSDQELLYLVLNPDQQTIFEVKFSNIQFR